MAVEASTVVASLLEKLKVDDPWLPPKPWESIPSESGCRGGRSRSLSQSPPSSNIYQTSSLSESSLVRLVMNALQGVESALIAIDKYSALFCSDSADRTFHRISNLWTRSSSTLSLGNLLKSIGQFGCVVFLLHKFVNCFLHLNPDGNSGFDENLSKRNGESKDEPRCERSLVNQAFAVAVKKVLDGYISALNTLHASVNLRRTLKNSGGGCLMDIGNAEITVLEVYLHTKGLRTQMEALGNICYISDVALNFSLSSFEGLNVEANKEFSNFPRGAALLTFLYKQLKVADPVHCTLLKFLFLQSCEPYYGLIRSWIYEGRISDPYEEFVVEYIVNPPANAPGNAGISIEFPLNSVRVRNGVTLPCFLEEFLIPLLRAGQQLQVVIKLLDLCNNLGSYDNNHGEILPLLDDLSSVYPIFTSALTFQKGAIENMTIARNSFYQRMLEKVDNVLTKFEFRSRQVSPQGVQFLYAAKHGRNLKHSGSVVDHSLILPETGGRDQNLPVNYMEDEASSTADEFSYAEDLLESSESSSVNSVEEQNETEHMCNRNMQLEPSYLSSLSFSFSLSADNSVQMPCQSEILHTTKGPTSEIFGRTEKPCHDMGPYHGEANISDRPLPLQFGEPNLFQIDYTEIADSQHDIGVQFECPSDNPSFMNGGKCGFTSFCMTRGLEVWDTDMLYSNDAIFFGSALMKTISDRNRHPTGSCTVSNTASEQSWDLRYSSSFLSMNPILSKGYSFSCTNKPGERHSTDNKQLLSYFDFTSVRDPCHIGDKKLAHGPRHQFAVELPFSTDAVASAVMNSSDCCHKEGCSDESLEENTKSSGVHVSSDSKANNGEDTIPANKTGGSGWETVLACFDNIPDTTASGYGASSIAEFEMPLDYVVKKCLWEEIMLQYRYVSKLTIKLLEEGFCLQDHLLALRRYHFMELADWADLFIMSLWHHKWIITEVDKRIPEIQGVLELSVQRSSCEGDPNKDRLYVYRKGDCVMPLSASVTGIHFFDFLGLGYQVDWPVSIILTPSALKIYSDIFNFLIQVKLAVFSLSDAWCSLKDLVQLTACSRRSELPKSALHRIFALTETRQQVNHFVSTLQQYVQSQLSHVSWCKFLNSLKHKVKDMMDLEALHLAYLTESLQICFLSDETRSIASIIESILQCAVDFRSCVIGYALEVGPSGKDSLDELSRIDIVQVLAIKETFTKNLNDLFLYYLKSPKHGEYGLSRFWDYLNSNEYYAKVIGKQLGNYILPI